MNDYVVSSKQNNSYVVQLQEGTCECPVYIKFGKPCKHIIAALLFAGQITSNRHTLSISKALMVEALVELGIDTNKDLIKNEELADTDSDSEMECKVIIDDSDNDKGNIEPMAPINNNNAEYAETDSSSNDSSTSNESRNNRRNEKSKKNANSK